MGVRKLRTNERRPDLYKTFIVLSDEKHDKEETTVEPDDAEAKDQDTEKAAQTFEEVPINGAGEHTILFDHGEEGSEDLFEAYKKAAAKYGRVRQSLFSIIMAAVFFFAFFSLLIAILVSPKGIIFSEKCKSVNLTESMLNTCKSHLNSSSLAADILKCRDLEYLKSCMAISVAKVTTGSCSLKEIIKMSLQSISIMEITLNLTSTICQADTDNLLK